MADHFTHQHFNCYKQYLNDPNVKIPKELKVESTLREENLKLSFSASKQVFSKIKRLFKQLSSLNRIISQTKTKLMVN